MHSILIGMIVTSLLGCPSKIKDQVKLSEIKIQREKPINVTPHRGFNIPLGARYMPHQALIVFKENTEEQRIKSLLRRFGLEEVYRGKYANILVVEGAQDATRIVSLLKDEPDVAIVEPNYICHLLWTPNDTYFHLQWHFDQDHIRMEEAWDIEQGGSQAVKVGILDTGIAYENRAIPGYEQGEVTSNDGFYHIAPDLTGTHFSGGYDAVHQDNYPNDQHGHGTHVSGTVAQTTNNSYGVAGIAFNVTLVPVQVLNYYGEGTTAEIVDGISYAISYGVNVLNMSFGSSDSSHAIHQVLREAYNNGITLIGASGNNGVGAIFYPAAFPEVISVGATDYDDERAPYSNYGQGLDLVAPGGNTSEDSNGDGYKDGVLQQTYSYSSTGPGDTTVVDSFVFWFWQGTSMATPHVTGVAALLISKGLTTPQSIKNALIQGTVDLGDPGYDIYFGNGRLDAYKALTHTQNAYWDTLSAPFEEPYVYFQEQYQVEYEATKLFPSARCTLKTIDFAFYNYGSDNNASKACSVFVWTNGAGHPGQRLLERAFTVTGIPAGYWTWVSVDVSGYNIVVDDTFWIGHFEVTSGPPTSISDTIPEFTNMWSLNGTTWSLDPYDYMERAIVRCAGGAVSELTTGRGNFGLMIMNNPSRGGAQIIFNLREHNDATVSLYDVTGRKIKKTTLKSPTSGLHRWNTGKLPSGVYFIEIKQSKKVAVKKLVIL